MIELTPAWRLGLAFGAGDVVVAVVAFRLGWLTLARRARRGWDDEPEPAADEATEQWLASLGQPEPEPETVPIVITHARLAASLPRALPVSEPAYVPDPGRVQVLRRWADPEREYLGEYREVWDERPARLAAIDELVELLAARVGLLHDAKRRLVTEWEGQNVQSDRVVSEQHSRAAEGTGGAAGDGHEPGPGAKADSAVHDHISDDA